MNKIKLLAYVESSSVDSGDATYFQEVFLILKIFEICGIYTANVSLAICRPSSNGLMRRVQKRGQLAQWQLFNFHVHVFMSSLLMIPRSTNQYKHVRQSVYILSFDVIEIISTLISGWWTPERVKSSCPENATCI